MMEYKKVLKKNNKYKIILQIYIILIYFYLNQKNNKFNVLKNSMKNR